MATETNDDFDYQSAWIELRARVQRLRDENQGIIDSNCQAQWLTNWGIILACDGILKQMEDLRGEMVTVRICMPDGEQP